LLQFLGTVTGWLNDASIPYMVAGSFASTLHGRPRSTQDVDIVIHPTEKSLRMFVASVPQERAYIDLPTAVAALHVRDMFNLIDMDTGWKADLIIRKARPFSVVEFDRRRLTHWLGLPVYVATPEDVVVSKLEWCRMSGGSQQQLNDVGGVLAAVGSGLDLAYIEEWVEKLKLQAEWARVLSQ
jgi:hypothetical protein